MNWKTEIQGFDDLDDSLVMAVEMAKQEFAIEMKRAIDRQGLSYTELAERLGVSKPMVTKLLRGDSNVTIETMVKAAMALGGNLFLKIVREGSSARFFEIAQMVNARQAGAVGAARHLRVPASAAGVKFWDMAANQEENENEPLAA